MNISKDKALALIDKRISQFREILDKATYENRYNEAYDIAYYGSIDLLKKLFSKDEEENFRQNVITFITKAFRPGEGINYHEELQDYKKRINKCIAQLKVYREHIQNFCEDEEVEKEAKPVIIPFVSMSFNKADQNINQYVTDILEALQIKYETGERYSKDSIPEKVEKRIRKSDLVIVIFVKREKLEKGGYTPPSWLILEYGLALGSGKNTIVWVEKCIEDKNIANLNYAKEIIHFERDNSKSIMEATIKFLEALKEHKLV